jgi:hypothetical protein
MHKFFTTKLFITVSLLVIFILFLASITIYDKALPSYWVWGGKLPAQTDKIDTLYLLQGYFWKGQDFRYDFQGPRPEKQKVSMLPLVLTYRLQYLVPPEMVASRYSAHAKAWRERGGFVKGVQIDYDSPSSRLQEYSQWLGHLRTLLEKEAELSTTGLADWLLSAEPEGLNTLLQKTDYTAFMMYQGRSPLSPVTPFSIALRKLSHPFKLGVLKDQANDESFSRVRRTANYLGDIQFILPDGRE